MRSGRSKKYCSSIRKYSCSGADGGEDPPGVAVAEQLQSADRRLAQRIHGAQQRDLVVQRLTRPRRERGGDAQQCSVGVLQDERRARRVPGGVAAGLERGADAAGGERRGVGLALDELLAGELGQGRALAGGAVEAVVLLRGETGQRLEDVCVMGGALLKRPLLHGQGDGVGEAGVQGLSAGQGLGQLLEDVLGQSSALDGGAEDVRAEYLVVGGGEVRGPDPVPVGTPPGGMDVLLADRHSLWLFLPGRGGRESDSPGARHWDFSLKTSAKGRRRLVTGHYPNGQTACPEVGRTANKCRYLVPSSRETPKPAST